MANVVRFAVWRVALVALFMLPTVFLMTDGRAQTSAGSHAQGRMARAVDMIFREGVHAQLPPHISTLLGLTREEECPMMQRALRSGTTVQGFNVSTANKNDVVVFVVNEATNDQTLYLTSAEGRLRKVVAVEAGVGKVRRINEEDRKAFAEQKRFWLDRLAPAHASK